MSSNKKTTSRVQGGWASSSSSKNKTECIESITKLNNLRRDTYNLKSIYLARSPIKMAEPVEKLVYKENQNLDKRQRPADINIRFV